MLVIAVVVQAGENRAQQDATATSELIEVLRTGTGQRRWRARFDAAINADHVDILLRINLVPGPGITRPQLERLQQSWQSGIEELWSNHFAVRNGTRTRPIRLRLQFGRTEPHYTVVLTNDAALHLDPVRWSRYASVRMIAHEIGHMLGAWDEYAGGGGQQPDDPRVDPMSVMGGATDNSVRCFARHFELIRTWAVRHLGDAEIVPFTQALN